MSIVVGDTSPIRALVHLNMLDLLQKLYGSAYVPDAVADELRTAGRRFGPFDPSTVPYLHIESPQDQERVKDPLLMELDAGEAAAIALCIEKSATRLLIDELQGRHIAAKLGLPIIGVLGLLLAAKQNGHIAAIRPLIDRLQQELEFYMAPALVAHELQLAGE